MTGIVYQNWIWGDGDVMLWGDGDEIIFDLEISDADFLHWVRQNSSRITLIALLQFGYQNAGLPDESTIYLSDRPYVDEDDYVPQPYAAVIDGQPTFQRSLDITKLGGRGTASLSELVLANADGAHDYLLTYLLDGRDVAFYIGDPTWLRSQWRQIGTGTVASVNAPDDTKLTITLRDKNLMLDATIIGDEMTTGPNTGKPKPVLFGLNYNVDLTPYLFDTTGPTYYFNNYAQDSSAAFNNVLVRDAGVSLVNTGFSGTTSDITVNAGTDTITKTAHGLNANDVIRLDKDAFGLTAFTQYWVISSGLTADDFKVSTTRGGSAFNLTTATWTGTLAVASRRYYVDAADASIKLSAAPSGRVTADILSQGTSGDAAIQATPHAGMRYIIDTWTRLTSADRNTASFATLVASEQAAGIQWGTAILDRTNVLDVLDQIAVATNSWYGWDRTGLLKVGKFDLPNLDDETPLDSITEDDIGPGDPSYGNQPLPFGWLIVDANRNVVTQTDGLAGAVTAANRSLWAQQFQTRVKTTDPDGLQYLNDWPTYHKSAIDSKPLETAYVGSAAQDFCDERTELFQPYTSVFTCTVGLDKYALDVGDCVEVVYPRYSLDAGKNFRVASVKMRPGEKLIDLVLVRQNIPNWDALGVGVTVPDAPTIGTAVLGNTKATVAFTPPANNGGAAITSYRAISTPGSITATGTASPIVVTGLTNGVAYTFTVRATNSAGNSSESSASNSVTPASTVPDAPTIGSAEVASSTSVTVTFSAPADNGGSAITGYTVTASTGQTASGASSPITVTGLTSGTSVNFTVHATNANGNSAESSASNTVSPGGRPVALTISANVTAGYNIFAAALYPTDKVDVVVTINAGIDVAVTTGDTGYAMDTGTGWVEGSTIKIVLGSGAAIIGKGGKGGANGSGGNDGLPGIYMQWPLVIDNGGSILGGGGGGGAGAVIEGTSGGGGGGAGYGAVAAAFTGATEGGRTSAGNSGGFSPGGQGGNGGATATAGSNGNPGLGGGVGGTGGAAGYAIRKNGHTITWLATGTVTGTVG